MEGINNLGATCAINSLIQIICRNERLRNVILNANVDANTFTGEFKEILDLIHNQHKSIYPAKFLNSFYNTFKGIFSRFEQIDLNELWFYVFAKINEETSIPTKLSFETITNLNEEHEYKIDIYNNKKTSELLKLVQGSFINIICCDNCKHKSYSFEPFINISLDIDNDNNETIAQLIVNYIKDEYRPADDWKCDNCNKNSSYIKINRIWKIPKVLFLSLNRFKDHHNKNNKQVHINDNIIFNKGSILTLEHDCKFDLKAVGLHYGGLLGGHYTAICNIKEEEYYHYNDEQITIIKKNEVGDLINKNAYFIVFENN